VKLEHRDVQSYVVEPYVIDRAPKFYILGGLVLQELSRQYLKEWGNDWVKKAPEHFVYFDRQQAELFPNGPKKIVFLSRVLPSAATVGYEDLHTLVVKRINGVELQSLADIPAALDKATDGLQQSGVRRRSDRDLPRRQIGRGRRPDADAQVSAACAAAVKLIVDEFVRRRHMGRDLRLGCVVIDSSKHHEESWSASRAMSASRFPRAISRKALAAKRVHHSQSPALDFGRGRHPPHLAAQGSALPRSRRRVGTRAAARRAQVARALTRSGRAVRDRIVHASREHRPVTRLDRPHRILHRHRDRGRREPRQARPGSVRQSSGEHRRPPARCVVFEDAFVGIEAARAGA